MWSLTTQIQWQISSNRTPIRYIPVKRVQVDDFLLLGPDAAEVTQLGDNNGDMLDILGVGVFGPDGSYGLSPPRPSYDKFAGVHIRLYYTRSEVDSAILHPIYAFEHPSEEATCLLYKIVSPNSPLPPWKSTHKV